MKRFTSLPQKKPAKPVSKKPASKRQLKKMGFPEVHITHNDDSNYYLHKHIAYSDTAAEELLHRIRRYVRKNGGSTASIRTRRSVFRKSVNNTLIQQGELRYKVIIILEDVSLIIVIQPRKICSSHNALKTQYTTGRSRIIYKTVYSFSDFRQWFDSLIHNLKLIDHEKESR